MRMRFSRLFAAVFIIGLGIGPAAQLRIPGHIQTVVTPSPMMAANQPQLYCGIKNGRQEGCWTKDKYDEWVRNQARLENWQQLNHGWDGGIETTYDETGWVQPSLTDAPEKNITLSLTTEVVDPETGEKFKLDTTQYGSNFYQEVMTVVGHAAPVVADFIANQERIKDIQRQVQNYFNQAVASKDNYVTQIRNNNKNLNKRIDQAEKDGIARAAEIAAKLNPKDLPPGLLEAVRQARELESNPLKYLEIEMSPEAVKLIEVLLQKLLEAGKLSQANRELEKLVVGKVEGQPIQSAVANDVTGGDGVMDLGALPNPMDGPFDDRPFETELYSPEGQAVRRMANRYQAFYHETEGLAYLDSTKRAQFVGGAVAISAADISLAAGDMVRGGALLEASHILLEAAKGFTAGMGQSLTDLVKGVPELAILLKDGVHALITDPEKAWANTMEFITSLDEVGAVLLQAINEDYETLVNGSAYERSKIVGYYALDAIQLFISAGSLNAVKAAAKVGGITRAVDKLKDGQKILSKMVDDRIARRAGQAVEKHLKEAQDLVPGVRQGLSKLNSRSPEIANALLLERTRAIRHNNGLTKEFIDRVFASGQQIEDVKTVHKAMRVHETVQNSAGTLDRVNYNGKVSRVAYEKVEVDGKTVVNNPESIFDRHGGQKIANGRMSIGGELGHSAHYVAVGGIEDTKYALIKELKEGGRIVLGEKHVNLTDLLDLTDAKTLDKLGLSVTDIDGPYLIPQAIGDAAKLSGFKGIIFKSAKDSELKNIAIFN